MASLPQAFLWRKKKKTIAETIGKFSRVEAFDMDSGRGRTNGYGFSRSWSSLVTKKVESTCNGGKLGSIPGLEISTGEGNGNPPQYSCLEWSMDRGTW